MEGSGYGYGTVPGGRWAIDTEGGHVVDSVSLIRSGYEYGTVPERRGTIHTESGRERGKFRIPNAIAMSHAVNCPIMYGRTSYTCSTSFHYDMAEKKLLKTFRSCARSILISDRHIDLLLSTEVAFLQSNI